MKRKPKKVPRLSRCPACHSRDLVDAKIEHEIRVGPSAAWASIPAQLCKTCGEDYAEGPAILAAERLMAKVLGGYEPTPDSFRFLRSVISLRSNELAELLGVAPETVSRWENGKAEIDRAAWLHLVNMIADLETGRTPTLDRLRDALKARGRHVPRRAFKLKFA